LEGKVTISRETTLCLDFLNTGFGRLSETSRELLASYEQFVSWSTGHGTISAQESQELLARAQRTPDAARAALSEVLSVRELLIRLLSAAAGGGEPSGTDLAHLSDTFRRFMRFFAAAWQKGGLRAGFVDRDSSLEWPLAPVIWAAFDLLTGGYANLGRLKRCADFGCSRFFLDMSRNGSRRWCQMRLCGNRQKARRFQDRRKTAAAAAAVAASARRPARVSSRQPSRPEAASGRYAGGADVEVGTDD
jgi:predicted RNA-binding Zn ribbon-like protein